MGRIVEAPKIIFCPRCHKPIRIRLKGMGNMNVLSTVTFECGDKNCSGKVVFKTREKIDG